MGCVGDRLAEFVGEVQSVGLVGVAGEPEGAFVVEAVVVTAEADEVVGVGGAAVAPVDDVVDVEPLGVGAAGGSAAAVAVFDGAACAAVDGADFAAFVDG